MERKKLKKAAGVKAVDFVRSGMLVGLGTGSTAEFAIEELSKRVKHGLLSQITCVPSSERTRKFSEALGLNLVKLDSAREIDLTIDGADEIDSEFNLIKGGGGALLMEKILAQNSKKNIIVADESKLSKRLGSLFPVPVEVLKLAVEVERRYLERLGAKARLRRSDNSSAFVTDQGNFIIDCGFPGIDDPSLLADRLSKRAGIVEHGIFINTVNDLVIGSVDGVKHFVARDATD